MRGLLAAVLLGTASLFAGGACAERTESTVVTIPTATPARVPAPTADTRPSPTAIPRPSPTPTATPTPSPTPTPEPSIATAKAAALLVSTLRVTAAEVTYETISPMAWPNAALGCPEPGTAYADVIVPGWLIILRYDSKLYEYHADREGERVITCDPKLVRTYGKVNFAEELRLVNVSRVEIAAVYQSGRSVPVVAIDRPEEIASVVASLEIDLPLYEQKGCEALFEISFVMGERVEWLLYACEGDGTVLRGSETVTHGREARAPTDFQKVINLALANRPFPTPPR